MDDELDIKGKKRIKELGKLFSKYTLKRKENW